jgi:hypothetical protein
MALPWQRAASVVDVHRGGPARAAVAALLGAGQPGLLTQRVEQRRARINAEWQRPIIDPQLDIDGALRQCRRQRGWSRRCRVVGPADPLVQHETAGRGSEHNATCNIG